MDLINWLSSLGKYLILPQRVIVCIFGFMATVNAFVMRHSVDLVLTGRSSIKNSCTSKITDTPKFLKVLKVRLNFKHHGDGELYQRKLNLRVEKCFTPQPKLEMWSGQMRTAILVSFYFGYVVAHIPGGLMAERYGGKWVLAIALALTAALTLITPATVNNYGPKGLLVIRVLMGLSEGPVFPALSCMMAQWIPAQERGTLATVVLSAGHIGILIVNLLSGVLLPYIEWSLALYFVGACALLWVVCFIAFCFNDPESNPYIKESEKLYLQKSISSSNSLVVPGAFRPWRQILTTPAVYALISATIQHDWTQSLIVSEIHNVVSDLKDSTFWDNCWNCGKILIPFFLNWSVAVLSGILSDVLINRDILNTTEARQLMTLIAAFGPKICSGFTSCLLVNENNDLATVFNCAMGVMGTYYAGIKLTALDMSPNYAGTLTAIANGLGSIANIVAPYVDESTKKSGFFQNICSLIWIICTMFTTAEVQNFDTHLMETVK